MAIFTRILAALALSVLVSQSQAQQPCLQTSTDSFNLLARYKDTPTSSTPIKVIDVNTVPKVGYAILSACSTCSSAWIYSILDNGAMLPKTASTIPQTVSYSLLEGESPSYISIQFPPPPHTGYCMTANLVDPAGPLILAGNNRSDLWSLCPNSTASGRLDVVWSPVENHAHYVKSSCRDVYLERV